MAKVKRGIKVKRPNPLKDPRNDLGMGDTGIGHGQIWADIKGRKVRVYRERHVTAQELKLHRGVAKRSDLMVEVVEIHFTNDKPKVSINRDICADE